MIRLTALLMLAIPLAACAGTAPPVSASSIVTIAADRFDAIDARYRRLRTVALIAATLLPEPHATRLRGLLDTIDAKVAVLRMLRTAAAAAEVEQLLGALDAAADG